MSFFNRIRPDPGFVSPVRSDPIQVLSVRSDPIQSGPIRLLSTALGNAKFTSRKANTNNEEAVARPRPQGKETQHALGIALID